MFFNGDTPDKKDCCGCSACIKICPKSALGFKEDSEGFLYPVLDATKCIECGLCEKACPMRHSGQTLPEKPGRSYAATSKDALELENSSSGGIFGIIAEYVLEKGGRVYGAAFDENIRLRHIHIDTIGDLGKLQGSKYVQSQNENVYREIRDCLNNGQLIYYCGTGCQVAGLKLFLRKDYDNLLTSDIFCHGVPPQKVFDETVRVLEKKHKGSVRNYRFRDKRIFGWSCSSSCDILKKGSLHYIGYDPVMDSYFNAFLDGIMYRESCYVCPFARKERCGDISLADFWGVENYLDLKDIRKGVSAVIVNTKTGERLLEEIKNRISLYPAKLSDIAVINKTLLKPTPRPEKRDDFFTRFKRNPSMIATEFAIPNRKRQLYCFLKSHALTAWILNKIK